MIILDKREQDSIYLKAKVLVVSKTRMGYSNVCIGSISEEGKYMRLLLPNSKKMISSIDIHINDYLIIEYQDVEPVVAPHYEDISIYYAKKISTNNIPLLPYIKSKGIKIWQGSPEVLFDNKLNWSSNSWSSKAYITENNIPEQSVGFWIPDQDMYLTNGRYEYIVNNITYSIKYVGVNYPFECIYKGMLTRVSLARWWKGDFMKDERCYLQISEFYPLEDEINTIEKIKQSIRNKTFLQINYFVNGEYQIFNNVKPYKLLFMDANYYLACEVETEYRFTLFRVSKIRTVLQTQIYFSFDKNIFEFTNYIQTPFSQYTENFKENLIEIKLEIDKLKTSYFEIKNYLPSQKILERKENGNMIISFVVTQQRELEDLIKKWIPYIKIIKPISLDQKIRHDITSYMQDN